MEDEDEEARALLQRGPEPESSVQGAPRVLPALCDPSRLAHRLVVLLLMCLLGFGEPGRARAEGEGVLGFAPRSALPRVPSRERDLETELATFVLFSRDPLCCSFSPGTQLRSIAEFQSVPMSFFAPFQGNPSPRAFLALGWFSGSVCALLAT